MKTTSQKFDYYYDEIMSEMDYTLWIELTKKYLQKKGFHLDIACGTGTLSLALKQLGYQSEGLDISKLMLETAKLKAQINHKIIPYYHQDMTSFNLEKKYQVITCYFDSINHLNSLDLIKKTFNQVEKHLEKEGYFIFDVFSKTLFDSYENNYISEDFGDFSYTWKTNKKDKNTLCHKIIFNEYTETTEEIFEETYYDYKQLLDPRFKVVEILGDFTEEVNNETERILIVLQKLN